MSEERGSGGRDSVERTLHEYCRYIDARSFDELAGLFTADCVLVLGNGDESTIRTPSAYRRWLPPRLSRFSRTFHRLCEIQVDVDLDGESASACSTVEAWHEFVDGSPVGFLRGVYQDRLVRHESRYLIATRTFVVSESQNMPQIGLATPAGS
jgi:SnoaL-like domain